MSAYDFKPLGGSLKLKGGESLKGDKKKKKSKSRSSTSSDVKSGTPSGSSSGGTKSTGGADGQEAGGSSSAGRPRTEAERKFEEMQAKRMRDKIAKEARKTHKEKVDEFNKYLGSLSEHHDIPKVGPG